MEAKDEIEKRKEDITTALSHHKVGIESIEATEGPSLTLYEVVPEAGTKVSSVKKLEDDIAMSIAAEGVRIVAPLPGRGTIGIEVPKEEPDIVTVDKVGDGDIEGKELPLKLGKSVEGEDVVHDLTKMPHLLMAGATGQGKSVAINVMIKSLMGNLSPDQVKFLMIDPKRVELAPYKDAKPYLADSEGVVSEMPKAVDKLDAICQEMEYRYNLLESARVRNIQEYNKKRESGKITSIGGFKHLPYIVIIVDEFADLIMSEGKQAEDKIVRISQLARAVGIHLILATQRPSTKVITGLIKANIPVRISFKLPTNIDSRTVLDEKGAESLMGKGDALLKDSTTTTRFQCAYVDIDEIDKMVEGVKGLEESPYALHKTPEEGSEEVPKEVDKETEEEPTKPCEEDNTLLCNEDVAKYVETSEKDLHEMKVSFEEKGEFSVISFDGLWFVYYNASQFQHDKDIILSEMERVG